MLVLEAELLLALPLLLTFVQLVELPPLAVESHQLELMQRMTYAVIIPACWLKFCLSCAKLSAAPPLC